MSLRPGCLVVWSGLSVSNSGPRVFTWGALASSLPTPPPLPAPHPPTPSKLWAEIEAHHRKNRLKRLEIQQGTTSKVNCILFNSLLNKVLLNKSGLVRVKPGNINLKTSNRCFSNYYQVRTWSVFVDPVTYVHG